MGIDVASTAVGSDQAVRGPLADAWQTLSAFLIKNRPDNMGTVYNL